MFQTFQLILMTQRGQRNNPHEADILELPRGWPNPRQSEHSGFSLKTQNLMFSFSVKLKQSFLPPFLKLCLLTLSEITSLSHLLVLLEASCWPGMITLHSQSPLALVLSFTLLSPMILTPFPGLSLASTVLVSSLKNSLSGILSLIFPSQSTLLG